ncbi:MAG TPA: type II secretion system F family protein [Gaiellaceae bacterium]|jgi:type IV pilus assembly protein PilC|nr:type II secretion system F family protein [Gaiellaceae bacterium]
MAEFAYDAINAQGLLTTGTVSAPDISSAREQLQARGLLPSSLKERAAAGEESFGSMFKKVKPKSLQVFARQLATMIEAGVSVVAALVTLEEQTDDKYLKEIVGEVRADVESGMIFSRALGRHPKVFSRLFVAMVAAGESSGTLDTVLDRVATQIEKETKLKRRVKSAMVYPTVVLTFATLVLIFMLMFIVPVFQKVFDELNGQLPTPTRIIIALSHALRGYWFIIFPVIGLIVYGLKRLKNTPEGTRRWDQFKLRVPMKIGDVVQKVALARISRTLATLVAAGVDIITALDIAAGTAGNWVLETALQRTSARVHDGVPISVPLQEDPIFPPMVGQMVKIGEETGELDKMLSKVADFYEDEVDASIASLTSIIEPLLMICVGAMVGTIVISMYLPMFKLLTLIK